MTFYLKYRPQKLEDLDIVSVRQSLIEIVKSKEIPHAFLFTGPKGTGKTSAARILAKTINCQRISEACSSGVAKSVQRIEPCNHCEQCVSITNGTNMDVIEMDAASNRGIDDIRALRDVVKLSPTKAKAKVYIIDEAHMLTTEALNALLKTLEEPPSHVYFILATTNPEKLIETIKSRTTIINFTKATTTETKRSLQRIIKKEELRIKEDELEKIIKISSGSFRDAVKLLEQHSKDKDFLNNQKSFDADSFVQYLLDKNSKASFEEIKKAIVNGINIESITYEILTNLQQKLLVTKDKDLINLIEFILQSQEYNKFSPVEELPLQIAILKWFNFTNERRNLEQNSFGS